LGFSEYQVRDIKSLHRHFILVFCAYTFIMALQYRLLCKLTAQWQPNFHPFAGFEYQPLAKELVQAK
jgi:hypothetical protein